MNNSTELTKEELDILNKIKDKNYIIIINKVDLDKKINDSNLENVIYMSTINNIGIDELKSRIISMYELDKINTKDFNYLSSARSISLIEKAIICINKGIDLINESMPIDIVELEINKASEYLGDILGINYKEDLFDQLFSNFCLGK